MPGIRHAVISAFFILSWASGIGSHEARAQAATAAADPPSAITLQAGTKIELALTRPVMARTASPGESIYAQTTFPVTVGSALAIPAGTFVQGRLVKLTRPARRNNRGELQILFTEVIFANGYVAPLPGAGIGVSAEAATSAGETLMAVAVQVSTGNDVLLDNGAQVEMTLGAPQTLDAQMVAAAAPLSRVPMPGQFKSATLCRFIAGSPGTDGTPGTPDTVIPGSPGTPDTVIPGGPGMPDTVIPGTPATPSTTIPGTPGTPGSPGTPDIPCPAPPLVLSSTLVNAQSN